MILQIQDMSEVDKIHSYIRGLLTRTQAQVRYLNPTSLHSAMAIAISFDQAMTTSYNNNLRKPFIRTEYRKFDKNHSSSDVTAMELDNINKKRINVQQYKKEGRCFRSHEPGHIGINCEKFPGPASI